ncbi:MAG: hypothetical protein QW827_00830 [Candidatus Bathyarchaeia archaeon]
MGNMPFELFLFGIIFFGLMAILGAMRARQKGEKAYYLSAMASALVLLAFVLAFLDQPIPAFVIVITVGMMSFALLPKVLRASEREMVCQLEEMGISAPLRARELLTNKGWLKLASKHGLRKTTMLYFLLSTVIGGTILFMASAFFPAFISKEHALGFTAAYSIFGTYVYHRTLKKALTQLKMSAQSPKSQQPKF